MIHVHCKKKSLFMHNWLRKTKKKKEEERKIQEKRKGKINKIIIDTK